MVLKFSVNRSLKVTREKSPEMTTTAAVEVFENIDLLPFFSAVGAPQGLSLDNISIDYDPAKYARRRDLDGHFEPLIADTWEEKTRNNPRIYNGAKFRLQSVDLLGGDKARLQVGISGYKVGRPLITVYVGVP